MQQADDYLDALQKLNTSEWFPNLFQQYFAMFPVAPPEDVDPNTLNDETHSDDALGPDITTPEAQKLLAEMHNKQKYVCWMLAVMWLFSTYFSNSRIGSITMLLIRKAVHESIRKWSVIWDICKCSMLGCGEKYNKNIINFH